jgi:acyl-CoA synthetase (NDP forming)
VVILIVHINSRTQTDLSDALDAIDRIEGDDSQRAYLVEEMAASAIEMIGQLRCSALLDGWRGDEPADKDSLADCLVNLGALISQNPDISEMDLNPVRVYPKGILVLDALIQFTQK